VIKKIGNETRSSAPNHRTFSVYGSNSVWEVFEKHGLDKELLSAIYPSLSWERIEHDWNERSLQSRFLQRAVVAGTAGAKEKATQLGEGFVAKCLRGKKVEDIDVHCNT